MDIVKILSEDHCKIDRLLSDFRENTGSRDAEEKFEKLRWVLEKHLFIEERAVFTFLRQADSEDFASIPELEREHDMILEKLDAMDGSLKKKNAKGLTEETTELCNLLIKHKAFEDDRIYPKLDAELDREQKRIIAERIREFSGKN
jgi:iron-sulfur cluster repair protein YtfE (RIC family)